MGSSAKRVIAVDIGGTKTAVGIIDAGGKLLGAERFWTEPEKKGPDYAMDMMQQTAEKLMADLGLGPEAVVAAGVGVAGPLDAEKGIVYSPPNLPGWDELALKAGLESRLGVRTWMANDADAAALGEYLFGAGRGARFMVYITVSTGIGGGLVIRGDLYPGASFNAAEVGHMTINFGGRPCGCGGRGCLEAYASGASIARRAREKMVKHKDSLLWQMADGQSGKITSQLISEACRKGDPFARGIMDDTAFYLGVGVSNIVNMFNPDRIVLGGGVSNSFDLLISGIWAVLRERTFAMSLKAVDVVKAELGGEIGVYGAGALALKREGII